MDYGGFNDHPDTKNPAATAFRLPENVNGRLVSIILTHWDKDHYYSAVKKNVAAQACEWLVPRQMVSSQAVRFAAKLPNAKCWPESVGNQAVRIGIGHRDDLEIRKCKAFDHKAKNEDRNSSGLVVTILRWKRKDIKAMMILPGDCPFDAIPNVPSVPIFALVAYHHGSHVHWSKNTTKAISRMTTPRAMVYSFGRNNFGHPKRENYRPAWDRHSTSTKALRIRRHKFKNILWRRRMFALSVRRTVVRK